MPPPAVDSWKPWISWKTAGKVIHQPHYLKTFEQALASLGWLLPVYSLDPQNVIAGHSSFPDLCDNVHTVSIATASLKKQILKVYNLVVGRRSFVAICLKQYLFSCNDVTEDGGRQLFSF